MDYYNLEAAQAFLISTKAMISQSGKLLMLRIAGSDQWELPGGLLEMDEDLADGLIREVREETGLNVAVGKIVSVWDNRFGTFIVRDGRTLNVRIILIAYLCSTSESTIRISHEHDDFRWVPNEELTQMNLITNTREAIDAYVQLNL